MNKSHPQKNTNFETLRIPQLENLHRGISHKVEKLQEKMAADMGRSGIYDILPRNYGIIPEINMCSLHDRTLLEELHSEQFDCFWTMQHKKAIENDTLEQYYAEFKFYSLLDTLNDNELYEFYGRCDAYCNQQMSTHKIIACIMEYPNFLEEVMV